MTTPIVIEKDGDSERVYDVFSRLQKDRIIFLGSGVDERVANVVIAQLLCLESQDPEKDIYMYINSPGGSVVDGLAIYDTMQYIKPSVSTVCVGQASSMGCLLLSAGEKGKRFALPHSRIMMHPVSGGFRGQSPDAYIQFKEMEHAQTTLNELLAQHCGKSVDRIVADFQRDNFMRPEEALEYGIIDAIHTKSTRQKDE